MLSNKTILLLFKQHPRYDDCEHDLAFLVLDHPLVYNERVQPMVNLSDRLFDAEAVASNNCAVSGWGAISMGKNLR